MEKTQRIVLTGGSGFIGTALIGELQKQGYTNLVSISANHSTASSEVESVIASLSNTDALRGAIHANDIVVHLASSSTPATSETQRSQDITENLIGSVSLFEVCAEKGVEKIIYLSSGGTVYGETNGTASKETDPTHPKSSYGALKLSIEHYLEVFGSLYNLPYTIVRLSNAYGKKNVGGIHRSVIDIFLAKSLAHEPLSVNGDGSTVRDYIYIDDAVSFLVEAIENQAWMGIYNLGSGVGTSLNEVIAAVDSALGYSSEVVHRPANAHEVSRIVLNTEKARALGWEPRHTLPEGIRAILAQSN